MKCSVEGYAAMLRRLKMFVKPLKPLKKLILLIDGVDGLRGRGVAFGVSVLLTERSSAEGGSTTEDEEQLDVIEGSSSGVGGDAPCGLLELRKADGARRGVAVPASDAAVLEADFLRRLPLLLLRLPCPLSDLADRFDPRGTESNRDLNLEDSLRAMGCTERS